MIDVTVNDREIPPGKVLVAEYGSVNDTIRPVKNVLATKKAIFGEVELVAVTGGWAIAGSMLRWDNGYYGVIWIQDNARHGYRFKDYDAARRKFESIKEV